MPDGDTAALVGGAGSDERPAVYVDDTHPVQTVVYRASALDSCLAELLAARTGEEPKEWDRATLDRFARGRRAEAETVKWLGKTKGIEAEATGSDQKEFDLTVFADFAADSPTRVVVRVHPDGIVPAGWVLDEGDRPASVLEIKSTVPGNFLAGEKYMLERYPWQFSAEMIATGLPMLLVVQNTTSNRRHLHYLATPPRVYSDLIARVMSVELAARLGQPVPCKRWSDFFCRYPWHQPEDGSGTADTSAVPRARGRAAREPEPAGNDEHALIGLASALNQIRDREKALKEEAETVRNEVIRIMGTRGKVRAGRWTLSKAENKRTNVRWSALDEQTKELLVGMGEGVVSESRYVTVSVVADPAEAPTPMNSMDSAGSVVVSTDG